MNIFFGLETDIINSNLKIPKFKNNFTFGHEIELLKAEINNNKKWKISKSVNNFDDDFYFVESKNLSDNEIYFLSLKSELDFNFNHEIEIDCIKDFSNYNFLIPGYLDSRFPTSNFDIFNRKGPKVNSQPFWFNRNQKIDWTEWKDLSEDVLHGLITDCLNEKN